jgi:hypothetical protein
LGAKGVQIAHETFPSTQEGKIIIIKIKIKKKKKKIQPSYETNHASSKQNI